MKLIQKTFKKIEIKKSKIAGCGVYATTGIKKGESICLFGGTTMTTKQMFRAVDSGKENSADPLFIDKDLYLDLDELSRSFNHSCDPNSFIRGTRRLIALKNIKSGEEITFDYSTTMVDEETITALGHPVWSRKCKCGTRNCVGRIDQFKKLPLKRQRFYLKQKYAPAFVLKMFSKNRKTKLSR